MSKINVLVLAGGPDAEREVSLAGGRAVAETLAQSPHFLAKYREVQSLDADELAALPGDCIFPVLHGPWGEGGPLQRLLETDGRPFVGSGSLASGVAIDKVLTKERARTLDIPTLEHQIVSADDELPRLDEPVIIKPIDDGSSVDLYLCRSMQEAQAARERAHQRHERLMIEPFVDGRELTVGILNGNALPVLEIRPADGLYSYDAKYDRDDTVYDTDPDLEPMLAAKLRRLSENLFRELRCRHIARVDWLLDPQRGPVLLELNTMPGFTSHSLVPMAARARGLDMLALCESLVRMALADHEAIHAGPPEPKHTFHTA
jgi:D-alanine-D-alanine ligase